MSIVSVKGLSKRYQIGEHAGYGSLRDEIVNPGNIDLLVGA